MRKIRRKMISNVKKITIGALTTTVMAGSALGVSIGTQLCSNVVFAEVVENEVEGNSDINEEITESSEKGDTNTNADVRKNDDLSQDTQPEGMSAASTDEENNGDEENNEKDNKTNEEELSADNNDVSDNNAKENESNSGDSVTIDSSRVLSAATNNSQQTTSEKPVVKSISFNKSVLNTGDELVVDVELDKNYGIEDISLNFVDDSMIERFGWDDSDKIINGFVKKGDSDIWEKKLRVYDEYLTLEDEDSTSFTLRAISVRDITGVKTPEALFDFNDVKFAINKSAATEDKPIIKGLGFDKKNAQPGEPVKIIANLENDKGVVDYFLVVVGDWGFIGGMGYSFTNGMLDNYVDKDSVITLKKDNNGTYSGVWDTNYLKNQEGASGWYKFQGVSLYYNNGATVYRNFNSDYTENWIYIGSVGEKDNDVRTSKLVLNVGEEYNITDKVNDAAKKYAQNLEKEYGFFDPDLFTEYGYDYISGDNDIAIVDKNGNIKAVSSGKTKIQVVGNGNYGVAVIELEVKGEAVADYSAVEEAKAAIPSDADLSKYTDESVDALKAALSMVVEGKSIDEQDLVDEYARAINVAVMNLKLKDETVDSNGNNTTITEINNSGASAKLNTASKSAVAAGNNTGTIAKAASNTGSSTNVTPAPTTGDTNNTPVIAVAAAGAAAVAATVIFRKRKKED